MKKPIFSRLRGRAFLPLALVLVVSCGSIDSDLLGNVVGAGAGAFLGDEAGAAIGKAAAATAKAGEEFTPEQEYYLGRAVAATILQSYKVDTKSAYVTYLNEVCTTLALNSPMPDIYNGYHSAILETDEINAFATSGGHILVTRGILSSAASEDALAAVLAHEIAHIQLGHSIKAIRSGRITGAILSSANAALTATGAANAEVMDAFKGSVDDVVTTLVTKGYSQTQEFEADAYALSLMKAAGYDPRAMRDMLTLLGQKSTGKSGGFGSTHPSPQSRLQKVDEALKAPAFASYSSAGRAARDARFKTFASK